MPGKCRPSLRAKTLYNVMRSDLSETDKRCIKAVFERFDTPPVRQGRWILHKNGSGTCDQCRFTQKNVWDDDNVQNYCGVCGAKMTGETDV